MDEIVGDRCGARSAEPDVQDARWVVDTRCPKKQARGGTVRRKSRFVEEEDVARLSRYRGFNIQYEGGKPGVKTMRRNHQKH